MFNLTMECTSQTYTLIFNTKLDLNKLAYNHKMAYNMAHIIWSVDQILQHTDEVFSWLVRTLKCVRPTSTYMGESHLANSNVLLGQKK